MNAYMELVGFNASNKVKNHSSNERVFIGVVVILQLEVKETCRKLRLPSVVFLHPLLSVYYFR